MTKEEAIKYLQQLYPNGGHCWLDEQRMEAIGMAIQALQEEPVSEKKCIFTKDSYIDEERKVLCEDCKEKCEYSKKEEPVCDYLEEAMQHNAPDNIGIDDLLYWRNGFITGSKWQKANLWKPADGDGLPEIDREVIVLIKYDAQRNMHDDEYPTYRVEFGHRPNPDGWDGKNIDTDEVTHYAPKLYDKGGWNSPDVKYWLDCSMPNLGED